MNHSCTKLLAVFWIISILLFSATAVLADTDIAAKKAPFSVKGKFHQRNLACEEFIYESFEDWYPEGWDQIITNGDYTWYQSTYSPYDGSANAEVVYDPNLVPQSEWMISPTINLSGTSSLTLDFWFLTSYYWHVDPYDNGDMEIRVSTDDGATWSEPLWTENEYGEFENWTWYNQTLDFSAYLGVTNFKFALVYEGTDGAQADFDAVLFEGEQQFTHDVAVTEFVSPGPLGDPNVPITPQILVQNNGAETETFTLSLGISTGGSDVYYETATISNLAAGATYTATMPSYTPVLQALYNLTAVADLASDENAANNARTMIYNTMPIAYIDYDFEADNGGFTGDNDWEYGEITGGPGSGHSGVNGWGTVLSGPYTVGPLLSTLITPEFEIGTDGILTFWHWYATESGYDGGNIKISVNGGVDWDLLNPDDSYDGTISSSYENPIGGEEAWYGESGAWVQESFDLSSYASQPVMFKFDFGSDNSVVDGDGWYIDDFHMEYYEEVIGIVETDILPSQFTLAQNYPNPFNAKTTINFTVPSQSQVDLEIYNLLGQKIATLVSQNIAAGNYSINWDASNVGSGVYFYKLTANNFTETRSLTLIK